MGQQSSRECEMANLDAKSAFVQKLRKNANVVAEQKRQARVHFLDSLKPLHVDVLQLGIDKMKRELEVVSLTGQRKCTFLLCTLFPYLKHAYELSVTHDANVEFSKWLQHQLARVLVSTEMVTGLTFCCVMNHTKDCGKNVHLLNQSELPYTCPDVYSIEVMW